MNLFDIYFKENIEFLTEFKLANNIVEIELFKLSILLNCNIFECSSLNEFSITLQ